MKWIRKFRAKQLRKASAIAFRRAELYDDQTEVYPHLASRNDSEANTHRNRALAYLEKAERLYPVVR